MKYLAKLVYAQLNMSKDIIVDLDLQQLLRSWHLDMHKKLL